MVDLNAFDPNIFSSKNLKLLESIFPFFILSNYAIISYFKSENEIHLGIILSLLNESGVGLFYNDSKIPKYISNKSAHY